MTSPRDRGRRRRREGLTLVEIMVVVIIIAIATTGVTVAFRAINRSELRSACMKIIAASRFGYSRSITRGTTVRLLLDLERHTMTLEEAHGRLTLARADDPSREDEGEEDGAAVDPWEAARRRLSTTLTPSIGGSPFGPIRGREDEVLDRTVTQPVGNGIRIVKVITSHEPAPREQGRGAIYFFPSGIGETAAVQLSDGNGDEVYTVELDGLTGRGEVHAFAHEPELVPEGSDDERDSTVRDPG